MPDAYEHDMITVKRRGKTFEVPDAHRFIMSLRKLPKEAREAAIVKKFWC
jgi:hypothetical protein